MWMGSLFTIFSSLMFNIYLLLDLEIGERSLVGDLTVEDFLKSPKLIYMHPNLDY